VAEGFSNIQIETSDITLHERLFEQVFHAASVERLDHPQTDLIRIYCLREVVVTIRQDLRHPRETGWVQINFWVKDVASIHETLQLAVRESSLAQLPEKDRDKIVRFRMKPNVMRGHRKVDRLEVYGPEGFLVGFDQPH
jgi:CRISPR/Cas system-associated endoribonuclease Cas2